MFNRSRRNLARWFTLSMGSILIVFAGIIYYLKAEDSLKAVDSLLYKKARVMAASIEYKFSQGNPNFDLTEVPILGNIAQPLDSEVVYARWYDAQGQLVRFFGTSAPEKLSMEPGFHTVTVTLDTNDLISSKIRVRQVTLPVEEKNVLIGYLQIALPLGNTQAELAQFRLLLTLALPIALGLIGLVGWILGSIAMQPILQTYLQLKRFTADASHELRTPISGILSTAQVGLLISEDNNQESSQSLLFQLQSHLKDIAQIAQSMRTLVNNLLFLARNEGQLTSDRLRYFNLVELLQDLIDDYEIQAEEYKLNIIGDLPDEEVMIYAEPELLRQAVSNLVSNACKYTSAGGVVQVRLLVQLYWIIIQVKDNGDGIPADDLPYIFERFYRVNTKKKRDQEGFGLGLAIVNQIVRAHGGRVQVKSTIGQGTTFQIEFVRFY
ncbi:integral membrane sensor signal transduction histidine kinase [Gloeothece citriformis PCC 7424]|uniref:histidine kinase n=1 Tax=Gloeothece citriformis (strain PCC 7424) TaxID=65393 RepID=B7KKG7_GLOC7|nr:HAMP domain-containing sensor histidine kinase [Gloeothece citriformis]ACK72300.1 integral membrane sensor signal transduction histidine kinase [Gloeothece citriformis PCC 7424]